MKKVLSVALAVVMLVSLFAVNAFALVPEAQDKTIDLSVKESAVAEAQTYDDETSYTLFTAKAYAADGIETVKEDPADAESNSVMEIKYVKTYDEEGTLIGVPHPAAQLNDGAQGKNTLSTGAVIPATYMVEFDVCAKDNSTGLLFTRRGEENVVQAALGIHPDDVTVGTWYTYRFYIDESGYRSFAKTDADYANKAKSAFLNGLTAYRKERGSSAAFENVTKDIILRTAGNAAVGFALAATDKYMLRTGIDTTTDTVGEQKNIYKEAYDACWQLDNIGIYNYTIPEDYEIVEGIMNTFDMETWKNEGTAVVFEQAQEADGNNYVKVYVGTDEAKAKEASWSFGSFYDMTTEDSTPDVFTFSVDVKNDVLGAGITFEIHGDRESDDVTTFARRSIMIESDASRVGTWYTYRFICRDDGGSTYNIKPYRRLRGSDDEWEEVNFEISSAGANRDEEDLFFSAGTGSGANRIRKWRFGLWMNQLAPYTGADKLRNSEAVWCVDNVQFTDSAAVAGIINEENGTIDAELCIAGAAKASKAFIAIYDGDRFVGAGTAVVDGEGWVDITVSDYQDGCTAKLFVWDWDETNAPLLREAMDITELL